MKENSSEEAFTERIPDNQDKVKDKSERESSISKEIDAYITAGAEKYLGPVLGPMAVEMVRRFLESFKEKREKDQKYVIQDESAGGQGGKEILSQEEEIATEAGAGEKAKEIGLETQQEIDKVNQEYALKEGQVETERAQEAKELNKQHTEKRAGFLSKLVRRGLSIGVGFIPGIGNAYDLLCAATGKDLIMGEKLSWSERLLYAGCGLIPGGAEAAGIFKGGKGVLKEVGAAMKGGELFKGVGKIGKESLSYEKVMKGVGKGKEILQDVNLIKAGSLEKIIKCGKQLSQIKEGSTKLPSGIERIIVSAGNSMEKNPDLFNRALQKGLRAFSSRAGVKEKE